MVKSLWTLGLALGLSSSLWAAEPPLTVEMHVIDANGIGAAVGTVRIEAREYGVLISPQLKGLEPGIHGFHVHTNPNCASAEKDGKPVAGLAAGGHYDPQQTNLHQGPYGTGHLGDLPALYVAADGSANYPVLAPRLKLADLTGRSLMIHAGGDNHADHPAPLGGGGARVVCGVVK